jgi:hypothetical protein
VLKMEQVFSQATLDRFNSLGREPLLGCRLLRNKFLGTSFNTYRDRRRPSSRGAFCGRCLKFGPVHTSVWCNGHLCACDEGITPKGVGSPSRRRSGTDTTARFQTVSELRQHWPHLFVVQKPALSLSRDDQLTSSIHQLLNLGLGDGQIIQLRHRHSHID